MLDGELQSPFGEPEQAPEGKVKVRLICPLYEITVMAADKVLLPGAEGDILIMPDRAPIFVYLRAGRMVIYNKGEEPVSYFVSAGVCEVRRNLCPVLAWGIREDQVDPAIIAGQLADSKRVLGLLRSGLSQHEVISRIQFFETILRLMNYTPEEGEQPKSDEKFNPYQLKAKK